MALGLLAIPALAVALLSTAPTGAKSWYWQNPLPQGNALYGVAADVSNQVWAVGNVGTVLHSSDAGVTWVAQDPNTQAQLRAIDFADHTTGWLVGLAGTVRATTDGGSTWTTQTSGTAANLYGVAIPDPSTGWTVGQTGTILQTTDAGATWTAQSSGTALQLNAIDAISTTQAWAVGNAATILRTTNGSTWTTQTVPVGVTANLSGVDFVDENTGYAVGAGRTVLKTTDGGSTWTTQSVPVAATTTFYGVSFSDLSTGWIVGAGGILVHTTDGGETWSSSQYGVNVALYGTAAVSGLNAHVVGNTGTLLRTTDGGTSWLTQVPGTRSQLNDVYFLDATTGWATGGSGLIMKTVDGGTTWLNRSSGGTTAWQGVDFADADYGWAVGSTGGIRRTSNGGDTWTAQASGVTVTLNSVSAVTSQTAYSAGNGGVALRTTDGGSTWTTMPVGVTTNLMDVFFIDQNTGWIVGQTNTIRKTTDGGTTWVAQPLGAASYLRDVFFTDANNGVVVGSTNNVIRYTTNGGATWNAAAAPAGSYYAVTMGDATNGWAVGANGAVVHTVDGGATWASQNSRAAGILYGVSAVGPDTAWLVGQVGVIRSTTDAGATWTSASFGTDRQLNAVRLLDEFMGWTVGNNGAILRTVDGLQWIVSSSGTTSNLLGVDLVSPTRGWAVGAAGTIRTTLDGVTWNGQASGTTSTINAVDFVDTDTGWYAASNATLGRTTDGGSTWTTQTPASIATSVALNGLSFADDSVGWAVGGVAGQSSTVLKTIDGGSTWIPQSTALPVGRILRSVSAVDTQTAWAAGDAGALIRTTNGGIDWTTVPTGVTVALYGIHFEDASHGWYVGARNAASVVSVIRRTIDGGATWSSQDPGTATTLRAVDFAGVDQGVIVGVAGTILHTTDASPPQTTITFDPPDPDGTNGWYVQSPEISFATTEPAITYFSQNGSAGPWQTYSLPFTLTSEGTTTIAFYSIDPGGNRETTQTTIVALDSVGPAAPTMVSASAVSTTAVLLTWPPTLDLVSGVSGYTILQDGAPVATTDASTTSALVSGLTENTLYTFNIVATDNAGNESSPSFPDTVAWTPLSSNEPLETLASMDPNAPDGLADWYVSTPTVTLEAVPATVTPRVTYYRWTGVPSAWATYTAPLESAPGSDTLEFFTRDLSGSGRPDEDPPKRLEVRYDPQVPTPVTDLATVSVGPEAVAITWNGSFDAHSGVNHYEVVESASGPIGVTPSTLFVAGGLTEQTEYTFGVVAVDVAGRRSAVATLAVATPPKAQPDPPQAVIASSPEPGYVYVNWTRSSKTLGSTRYRVYRSENGVDYTSVGLSEEGSAAASFVDAAPPSGRSYTWAVATVDERGEGALSTPTATSIPLVVPPRVEGLVSIVGSDSVLISWNPSVDANVEGYALIRGTSSQDATPVTLIAQTALTSYLDTTVVAGEPYWYTVRALNASAVAGLDSLELFVRARTPDAAFDPHRANPATDADVCASCHDTHIAADTTTGLRFAQGGPNEVATCLGCHSSTSAAWSDSAQHSAMNIFGASNPDGLVCMDCHGALTRDATPYDGFLYASGERLGTAVCYSCHGTSGMEGTVLPYGDLSDFDASAHSSVTSSSSAAGIACLTCHEKHSSRNESMLFYTRARQCTSCHTRTGFDPSRPDTLTTLVTGERSSGHVPSQAAIAAGASMDCANCHNTHALTQASPTVDPRNPGPSGAWTGTESAFCLSCHDGGPLPQGSETSPWAPAVLASAGAATTSDVATSWAKSPHGSAVSSATAADARLRPDMGYSIGDDIGCAGCHDSHGTHNPALLREEVLSADGLTRRGALIVADIPAGSISPTSPAGYDFRYLCSACHVYDPVDHDGRVGGIDTRAFGQTDCSACHRHAAVAAYPGGLL